MLTEQKKTLITSYAFMLFTTSEWKNLVRFVDGEIGATDERPDVEGIKNQILLTIKGHLDSHTEDMRKVRRG